MFPIAVVAHKNSMNRKPKQKTDCSANSQHGKQAKQRTCDKEEHATG
jgi:hypothetical protein